MTEALTMTRPLGSAEEIAQIQRHEVLYDEEMHKAEVIAPVHWQKFEQIAEPLHAYVYLVKSLGNLRGKRVLDAGCGTGRFAVILAKRGAQVEAFDISPRGIKTANEYARLNHVAGQTNFRALSFYDMDYPPHAFDYIVGCDILHHLDDKSCVVDLLHRAIKPGGKLVFMEPFRTANWIEKLRLRVPVPLDDEEPENWKKKITHADLNVFRSRFEVKVTPFHLFSRLDRVFKSEAARRRLGKLDVLLFTTLPFLRAYARTIVIELIPRQAS